MILNFWTCLCLIAGSAEITDVYHCQCVQLLQCQDATQDHINVVKTPLLKVKSIPHRHTCASPKFQNLVLLCSSIWPGTHDLPVSAIHWDYICAPLCLAVFISYLPDFFLHPLHAIGILWWEALVLMIRVLERDLENVISVNLRKRKICFQGIN